MLVLSPAAFLQAPRCSASPPPKLPARPPILFPGFALACREAALVDSSVWSQRDSRGGTVLHWAVWAGSIEVAQEWVSRFPASVDCVTDSGQTPLMWSAARGMSFSQICVHLLPSTPIPAPHQFYSLFRPLIFLPNPPRRPCPLILPASLQRKQKLPQLCTVFSWRQVPASTHRTCRDSRRL